MTSIMTSQLKETNMADGADAEKLRKQIVFLSNLIDSHKNDKAKNIINMKTSASLVNSTKNTRWSRWKKEGASRKSVVNPRRQRSCAEEKDVSLSHLTNSAKTTISNCQNNSVVPPSKFNYRRKPLQTSTALPVNNCTDAARSINTPLASKSLQLRRVVMKKEQTTPKSIQNPSTTIATSSASNHHNKYKLNRNNTTRTTTAPTASTNVQRQAVVRKIQPSASLSQSTNLPSTSTSNSNAQWLASQTKVKASKKMTSRTLTTKKGATTNNTTTQPVVAKGSKLKWRRKSLSQLKPSTQKKTKTVNRKETLTIQKGQKLKWRRRSLTQSKPVALKKAKMVSGKTEVSTNIPKASKLTWRRKSLTSRASSNLGTQRQKKTRLVHKSKYSIKRVDANQARLLSKTGYISHGCALTKTRKPLSNKSFVTRRLKYIANHSHLVSQPINPAGSGRTVNIRGVKYAVRSDRKTLRKIPTTRSKTTLSNITDHHSRHNFRTSSKFTRHHTGKFAFKTIKRQNSVNKYKTERANKILRRTIQTAQASLKKENKSKQYCMFYNKFGKCAKQKQGKCPYIHDSTKIAVCTRFLRGMCLQMDGTCSFSHKLDKEKMPICQYFLKGKCTKDDCPYSHVNVGRNAQICQDFLKGYCAQGYKCKKKHVLECEEFNTTGKCPNGDKCKLLHRTKTQKKQKRKRYFQDEIRDETTECPVKVKKQRHRNSDGFLPLEDSALNNTEEDTEQGDVNENSQAKPSVLLKIRPKFTSTTD